MAHSVLHHYVNPTLDDDDPNETGPDEWNAQHDIIVDASLIDHGGLSGLGDDDHPQYFLRTDAAALTRVNDTNVTLTLSANAPTALLAATSITVGWTGTLAASRGGTGVASLGTLSRTNDTNVTVTLGGTPAGSLIQDVSLTLGWSGQLSIARGGTGQATKQAAFDALSPMTTKGSVIVHDGSNNVELSLLAPGSYWLNSSDTLGGKWVTVQALTKTDDTNVTLTLGGSPTIAVLQATSLTLGWTGTLSQARGGTGSASPFANPSASVGLAAVNGSATTFMRSDAAPALSQAITPTWIGLHIHDAAALRVQGAGGYSSVGVTGAPANTTAGDTTTLRMFVGNVAAVTNLKKFQVDAESQAIGSGTHYAEWHAVVYQPSAADANGRHAYFQNNVQPSASNASGAHFTIITNLVHDSGAFAISSLSSILGQVAQNVALSTVTSMAAVSGTAAVSNGTATSATGLYSSVSVSTGTITTGIGVDVDRTQSGGTFTTAIGLRINAVSGTIGTDIAIQSLGGEHRFVGNVKIGANSSPTVALDVAGVVLVTTGYRQGTMTSGRVLRSDGTNFISAQLSFADLAEGGAWTAVTFDATNFTAATGLWTLDTSADQVTFKYKLVDKTMTIAFVFISTTVSATPTSLRFKIPASKTAANTSAIPCGAIDNNANLSSAQVESVAGDTKIYLYPAQLALIGGAGTWATSTNQTSVWGIIQFEIQ